MFLQENEDAAGSTLDYYSEIYLIKSRLFHPAIRNQLNPINMRPVTLTCPNHSPLIQDLKPQPG